MGIIKTINRKCKKLKNIFFGDKDLDLSNKKILITGSNSGIGLHVYKKIIDKNNILAFTNNDSNEIDKLISKKTTVIKCDFSNLKNLEIINNKIIEFKPNILINCAAKFGSENQSLENFEISDYNKILNINVFSILYIIQQSIKANCLEQILNLSSEMGSIEMNKSGGYYLYRNSKSLLNSITKNLAIDLKKKGVNVYCIHPGSVKTKMNTGGVDNPEYTAQKIINFCVINDEKYTGKFIDIEKKILKW